MQISRPSRKLLAVCAGGILLAIGLAIWLFSSRLPAARYGAVMVFDPLGKQAIMFGGRAEGLFGMRYYNDLWTFDTSTQDWKPIRTGRRPPGRLSPGMVYDPVGHQLIVFALFHIWHAGGVAEHLADGDVPDTFVV